MRNTSDGWYGIRTANHAARAASTKALAAVCKACAVTLEARK